MRAEEHWAKAARLEASRAKDLGDRDDYELIIWSCIQGGAHLASVILHSRGLTGDNEDQIHSDIPELTRELPPDVSRILAVLKSIENLGPRFVRGMEPIDPEIVRSCLAAYQAVKALAQQALKRPQGLKAGTA